MIKIVGFVYIDDTIVLTRPGTTASSEALVDLLYDLCSFAVSPGKAESQLSNPENLQILGLVHRRKDDMIWIVPPVDKLDRAES